MSYFHQERTSEGAEEGKEKQDTSKDKTTINENRSSQIETNIETAEIWNFISAT